MSHQPRRSRSRWPAIASQLSVLLALLLAGCKPSPQPISDAAIANIDSTYADLAERHVWSGYVLVAQGDEVLLSKGYGMADVEREIPNKSSTRFNLGSLILPFAATAVMILQDQGQLDIDDPLCEYLPPCEPAIQPILIRHVLGRTSGLGGEPRYVPADGGKWIDPGGTISHAPGELFDGALAEQQYRYVASVIERVSGEPFESFVRKAIFEPLNMSNTGFINGDSGLATGYAAFGEEAGADEIEVGKGMMGGLVYSSADDLLTWIRALHAGQIISQDALNEMFAPGIHAGGEGEESVSYGLGWWQGERNGHPASAHQGMGGGFLCNVEYFGEDDAAVIVLSNLYHEAGDLALAGGMLFPAP